MITQPTSSNNTKIPPTVSSPPSPSFSDTLKLFITGATIGPIVDSLHNQSLLVYDRAPINLLPVPSSSSSSSISVVPLPVAVESSLSTSYLFCSSWYVPILLGVAYVVLGQVLPQVVELLSNNKHKVSNLSSLSVPTVLSSVSDDDDDDKKIMSTPPSIILRNKAIAAVSTTSLIIKLSDFLQTQHHNIDDSILMINNNVMIMYVAALLQWIVLDGTISSFMIAFLVSIGGPLSELPFVANGFWHYIDSAADYLPLAAIDASDESWYKDLALSSITGPCYFAVTMDAIALGRWFRFKSPCDETNSNIK